MPNKYRQEVFNVLLAQLLQERGVITAPESIIKSPATRQRRMPDVIVTFRGLRTAIEGEVDDQPDAHDRALNSALKRVEDGIVHIGVAVVYPARLRQMEFARLKEELADGALDIAIITEAGTSGFVAGNVDHLKSALGHTFEQLVQEDIITNAVALIDAAVERFVMATEHKPGAMGRLAAVLGIRELPKDAHISAVSRISALVLANAMIFQVILANLDKRVLSPERIFGMAWVKHEFAKHWKFIIDEINYYPIFHLAREVVLDLSSGQDTLDAMEELSRVAVQIVNMRAALRHDLMGRIYHRLLADAKYLGTYYTTIPAAALLLKLALRPTAWGTAWHDLAQVEQLRVSDLSCGTGTLLMAAADAITDNYVSAAAEREQDIDIDALQTALVENIIYGYDVLASAIHLTASTLSLRSPHTPFAGMNLFSLPLGGKEHQLGSIEFLKGAEVQMPLDMFGALPVTQKVTAEATEELLFAPLPQLDLCVMNPPFTRSVGGNLLFGSSPDQERAAMQKKLKKLVGNPDVLANITAGLGAVFVATADPHIKKGGRIALVLPKALLSGVAWDKTRELLRRNYRVEYIIASQDAARWNFSESTDLSEVMLVAQKITESELPKFEPDEIGEDRVDYEVRPRTVAVNFWRNPTTTFDTLAVAQALTNNGVPDVECGQGALEITVGERKIAEAIALPWDTLREQTNWILPCAFAQADLVRVAYHLAAGTLWLPGYGKVAEIPLRPLGELGTLGPDGRDIHDGFKRSTSVTAYPAFWGHNAQQMYTLAQKPNDYLSPLPKAKKGRPLRKVEHLWPLAGEVLIPAVSRINTQKLIAIKLSQNVLSNVWWTFSFNDEFASEQRDKSLVLWQNSSLGLFLFLVNRVETEGAWVKFKKSALQELPMLDLTTLSPDQLTALANTYDRVCHETLQPFPEMATDAVRAEIDASIAQVLDLPDFAILRTMLAREPVVCMKRL